MRRHLNDWEIADMVLLIELIGQFHPCRDKEVKLDGYIRRMGNSRLGPVES